MRLFANKNRFLSKVALFVLMPLLVAAPLVTVWSDAVYAATQYTVTFNAHGGKLKRSEKTKKITKAARDDTLYGTLPSPTKSKADFLGWYTKNKGGKHITATSKITKDITLHARWSKCTVTYDLNGGKWPKSTKGGPCEVGKAAPTKPAPVKTGKKFKTWVKPAPGGSGNPVENPIMVAGVNKVQAAWKDDPTAKDTSGGNGNSGEGTPVDNVKACDETSIIKVGCTEEGDGIWKVLQIILNIMTGGVAILAVIGIILGAIKYVTAVDKDENVKKAKDNIRAAVVGLIIWGALYAILQFLIPGGLF
jgi:hypothetical protein